MIHITVMRIFSSNVHWIILLHISYVWRFYHAASRIKVNEFVLYWEIWHWDPFKENILLKKQTSDLSGGKMRISLLIFVISGNVSGTKRCHIEIRMIKLQRAEFKVSLKIKVIKWCSMQSTLLKCNCSHSKQYSVVCIVSMTLYACLMMLGHASNEMTVSWGISQLWTSVSSWIVLGATLQHHRGVLLDLGQVSVGDSRWYYFINPPGTSCILILNGSQDNVHWYASSDHHWPKSIHGASPQNSTHNTPIMTKWI